MNKLTDRSPLSRTDKLCLVALVGCFLAPNLAVWAMDTAAIRAAEVDKPQVEVVEVDIVPPIDCTPIVAAMEAVKEDPYREDIPLSRELQAVLRESCEVNGVALCDALGLIEVESGFQVDAVSREGCFGLFQLNPKYYPSDLTPAENIRAGVAHLAGQIDRYDGDIQAALRGYNKGWDDGDRAYARAVLDASEKWGCG